MESLNKLCEEIGMPDEGIKRLKDCTPRFGKNEIDDIAAGLNGEKTYSAAAAKLAGEDGFSQLKIMLVSALNAEKIYQSMHIGHDVFIATMKCFSRFVREHKESYGEYGFDRAFWAGRQLSLLLFRLGELEFERAEYEGKKAISVHIPSDADLSRDKLDESFAQAKAFFKKYFPDYANVKYFCYSWLMSPSLKKLLPENSKILSFQSRFEIVKQDEDSLGYVQWVFKNRNLAVKDYPENTSLQKNMKKYILSGGKIGEALGIMTDQSPSTL